MPRTDALRFDKSPPAARSFQHAPSILLTSASGASRRQNVWSYIRVAGGDVLHSTTQSPRSRSRPRPHNHDHDHDHDHDYDHDHDHNHDPVHSHCDQHCRPMVTIKQEGNRSAPQSNGLFQDIKFWFSMMVPGRNHLIICVTVCPFVPARPFPRADQQSCRQTEAKWCQLNGTQTCASWTMPGRQTPPPSITLCSCLTSCSSARQTRSNIGPPRTHACTEKTKQKGDVFLQPHQRLDRECAFPTRRCQNVPRRPDHRPLGKASELKHRASKHGKAPGKSRRRWEWSQASPGVTRKLCISRLNF